MRSLFAGVTALRNHQIKMDVIGNNIANVNTMGFKRSNVSFQDLVSQTMRDASGPQQDRGGVNPLQVGLGSALASISVEHTPGNPQLTGVETNLAIEGDGFFVLGSGMERFYTRAGLFDVDVDGSLVSAGNGYKVMGWTADQNGRIDTSSSIDQVIIPKDGTISPAATTSITFQGNLNAQWSSSLSYVPAEVTVEGADQNEYTIDYTIDRASTDTANDWTWTVQITDDSGNAVASISGRLQLSPDGTVTQIEADNPGDLVDGIYTLHSGGNTILHVRAPQIGSQEGGAFSISTTGTAEGDFNEARSYGFPPQHRRTSIEVFDSLGNPRNVFVDMVKYGDNRWQWIAAGEAEGFGFIEFDSNGRFVSQSGQITLNGGPGANDLSITPDFSGLVQYGDESTAMAAHQDGYPAGTLQRFSIDIRGVITGAFSNGVNRVLGQIAMATFANPGGLIKAGESMYQQSSNSGNAQIGAPDSESRGKIASGVLEMSNVDLSAEFTDMIITQRGFQANSRIITTSDEMLQELVNLKR